MNENILKKAREATVRFRELSVSGDWVTPVTRKEFEGLTDLMDSLILELEKSEHLNLTDAVDNGITGGIIVLDGNEVVVWERLPLESVAHQGEESGPE